MSRKSKSLLILIIFFVIVAATGGIYIWSFQKKDMDRMESELKILKANYSSMDALQKELAEMTKKVTVVDSVLFSGKFTIPQNITQSKFYDFVDYYSKDYSLYTYTNTEFVSESADNGFKYYTYRVYGVGSFNNVYKIIYAIEHSKELKKIESGEVTGNTSVDNKGVPHYLVKFDLQVRVYFSMSDQYAAVNYKENDLNPADLHEAFYPLIRNEIRPNVNNLPDIQDATLISLVPQGAFISDSKGNTLLLKKGDPVYLGYLTDIDYDNETVTFVLNKGGILEYETLKIGKNNKKEGRK